MFLGLKLLILWTLIRQTVGFLPSEENTNGRSEQTHSSITHDAIYRAAADVIAHVIDPGEHRLGSVDEILGNSLGCFKHTVEEIKNKNSLAQREYGDKASRTMHCDQIEAGHLLLQSLRDSIINQSQNAKPNWDLVRDLIGQYLFTLQEFYSNTNWVEMFGSRVCQELGISGNPLPFKVPTEITSKYQGFLTNKDRLWNKKCSTYLGTRIERGQSAPSSQSSAELSLEVHNHHQVAAVAATKASVAFLIRNDTGLLPILGIDKFTELLGLNSKSPCMTPGLFTAVVKDDQVSLDRRLRDIAKPLGKRRKRGSGGFNLFEQIAAATGGKIVHTSASSLGGILGEFVKNNMGVTTLQVASFEITSESQHKMSVDSDLTLLTIRIEGGFSSTTKFSLYRPDGTKQVFSGNASVDLIGRTTVISVQNPSAGEWILNKKSSGTWNVKVGGSGNIDFTYKFMEDVDGIKFPFTGTSPITGTTMILSVTITGLPPAASVSSIILKTPDGAILRSLPVNDTSNDPTRVLYTKFDVTPQEFLISINGSLNSTIFTREKSEVITPVAASIEFASKPEKLILGKSAAILVNVTNTGSVDQTFVMTILSDPVGFVNRTSQSEFVSAHSSKFVNITISPPLKTSASLTVKLSSRGTTLQTIKRTLQVADSEPPEMRTVNKSGNCAPDTMNYYNCSRQSWTSTMDIAFSANMKKLFVVPHNVNFTYSHNSSAPNIYTAKISGTCCSYRPLVTAIDGRGNTRTTTLDFSGGVFFNTTVDDFDHLVKSSEMESAPAVADSSLVYGLIGGVLGGLVVIAAILTSLIYYNKSRKRALMKNYLESLPSLCFEIQSQSVDRNSKPAFVMKN